MNTSSRSNLRAAIFGVSTASFGMENALEYIYGSSAPRQPDVTTGLIYHLPGSGYVSHEVSIACAVLYVIFIFTGILLLYFRPEAGQPRKFRFVPEAFGIFLGTIIAFALAVYFLLILSGFVLHN